LFIIDALVVLNNNVSCRQYLQANRILLLVVVLVLVLVPVRNIRDFPMFSVSSASKNCPSAKCASAANVVCRDVDVFGQKPLTLRHILR
jgi:hypothetical protein